MGALLEPGEHGLVMSEHTDPRPCVVCGTPTTGRVGRRKSPTAWAWRSPRCPDIAVCTARREAQKRHHFGRSGKRSQASAAERAPQRPRHIVLVGCAAQKRNRTAPADELYISPLFRSARQWAERNGDVWYILSAKHGLLTPRVLIDPYEQQLADLTPAQRAQWAANVANRLDRAEPGLARARVTALAGRLYVEGLQARLGPRLELPLAGLGVGERLAWFKRELTP